jgi:FkbM family methyltransferase
MTKKCDTPVYNNEDNQIIYVNKSLSYILPQNLLTCYAEQGLFESGLIEWCKQFCSANKSFLDIGAHTGTYSLSLSRFCKNVYCFEPQRMTYYALCGSVALSNLQNVICLNYGLGSEQQVGRNILNIVSNDGGGSTLHKTNMEILREEEIEIRTLDSLELNDVGFIKMDVEDNELSVLLGSEQTLKRCNYPKILFECNDTEKNRDLFDYFSSLGYNIISVGGANNMYLAEISHI